MNEKRKAREAHSYTVTELPLACQHELAAVEFMERQRWNGTPICPHCGVAGESYAMKDEKTGERSKRFLWRCRACKKQYTVRVGTVFEESRIPLRHWCYAFWRACTSKKGVAALEIQRQCQISYKSALFMLHRIRYAMMPAVEGEAKLTGTVEADETFVGGKPRYHAKGRGNQANARPKMTVAAQVQRGGNVKADVIADVSGDTLKAVLDENVDKTARLITDDWKGYIKPGQEFAAHETVCHSAGEYVRGDVTTNTIEGFFSIVKRGINGIYHSVSRRHLPKYIAEYAFRYNHRDTNDGARIVAAIRAAEGKRLMYREPVQN